VAELLSYNVNWAKAVLNSSLSPLSLSFSFLLYCSGKEADLFGGYRAWQHFVKYLGSSDRRRPHNKFYLRIGALPGQFPWWWS